LLHKYRVSVGSFWSVQLEEDSILINHLLIMVENIFITEWLFINFSVSSISIIEHFHKKVFFPRIILGAHIHVTEDNVSISTL